jgi:hypothetical protein
VGPVRAGGDKGGRDRRERWVRWLTRSAWAGLESERARI